MSDAEDDRILCKYGADCYQQNSAHLEKFKHPKKRVRSPSEKNSRKTKICTPEKKHKKQLKKSPKKQKTVGSHNDISDYDSDELSSKRPSKKPKKSPQKPKNSRNDTSTYDSDELQTEVSLKTTSKKLKNTPEKLRATTKKPKTALKPSHNMSDEESVNSIDEIIQKSPRPSEVNDITDEQLVELTETIENKSEWLESRNKLIKKFFLVKMPEDFYLFWDFCKEINHGNPKLAFDSIGLVLTGPFDVLASNKVTENTKGDHLLHCRYYFDPPEFQTVLKEDSTEYHIGYFRDSPDEYPCFLAENNGKDCIIKPIGMNIFTAVNTYFDNFILRANPFRRMELLRFQKRLKDKAKELNLDLKKNSKVRHPVCKSFHTAGIVVPFDKKTDLGYRPLTVTDKELLKLCDKVSKAPEESKSKAMSALQPVITAATIAIDECDFGTGLELGINLFCYGNELLNGTALRMLTSAYSVLDRHAFIDIAKAHLNNRKKGTPHVVNY